MLKENKLQNAQITEQNKQLQQIQDKIEKIVDTNSLLRKLRIVQDGVNDIKEEANSHSKFRKILRIIPTIKHWLIASTNEKIDRTILKTHKRLQEIDATIVEMGNKSSTIQKIIKEEIAIEAYKINTKLVNCIDLEAVNNTKNKLNELKLSPEELKKAAIRVYNQDELRELENQSFALLGIIANINALQNNNTNIPELTALQKELNLTLNGLNKSFIERIRYLWGKTKSVFKESSTQQLQKNTSSNSKIISDIDKNLEETLTKIEKSANLRKAKLSSQLDSMDKSLRYRPYEFEIEELDEKFRRAITDAGEFKQSQSTYLSSSIPVRDNNNVIEDQTDYHTQQHNEHEEIPKKAEIHLSAPNLPLKDVDTGSLNATILSSSDQAEINQVGTTLKNAKNQSLQQHIVNTLPKMKKKSHLER